MTVTILIIDDELHIRRLIAQMLELAGYQVLEAASGPEACICSKRQDPT